MKKTFRRCLSALLVIAVIISSLPYVYAATLSSGTDGGVDWILTEEGNAKKLVISPAKVPQDGYKSGEMKNYYPPVSWSECTDVEIVDGVLNVGGRAFWQCRNLTNISIPNSVTSIGTEAFAFCSSLINITIPDSATKIERGSFLGCSNLEQIYIPSSVTSLSKHAFDSCDKLKDVFYGGSKERLRNITVDDCCNEGCKDDPWYNTPDIVIFGFSYYYKLNNRITIDNSWKEVKTESQDKIEWTIYSSDSESKNILVIKPKSPYTEASVPQTGSSLFPKSIWEHENIAAIFIDEGITEIEKCAFSDCKAENVYLPDSLKIIHSSAFENCSSLQTVVSNSIGCSKNAMSKEIHENTFKSCPDLFSVSLPFGLREVEDIFSENNHLKYVTIPSTVNSFKKSIFDNLPRCFDDTTII